MKVAILTLTMFLVGGAGLTSNFHLDRLETRVQENAQIKTHDDIFEELKIVEEKRIEEAEVELQVEEKVTSKIQQDVRFTQYYVGDGYGTTDRTSTGTSLSSLPTNHLGMPLLNGRAVIATATYGCANSPTDECLSSGYLPLPQGFHIFQEGQEVDLMVETSNGIERIPAVVDDACGACFWHESKQRVDIPARVPITGWIEYEY